MNKTLKAGTQLGIALLAACVPLAAQAVTPGAGTILQQINPQTPQAPSSNETGIKPGKKEAVKLAPSAPFTVKEIQITGNTLFTTEVLHALVADAEGKSLTLADLKQLADRIVDFYHRHGYTLAQAVIPAQKIEGGRVTIQVIEGKYGKINLDNHSRVNDPLLAATLAPLKSGEPINQDQLDHVLLLLSDIPGETTRATLEPGAAVGTSDLTVETGTVPALNGNVAFDNYGNGYTGRSRLGGTLNVVDPLHHGDNLSLSVLTSGSGMSYARAGYETLLNGAGTRAGASYSSLQYSLGGNLASLNGHGTAAVESLWVKHPFVRSPILNIYANLQLDHKQLDDQTTGTDTNRHLDNLSATLTGDRRDTWLAGGISTWNLGVTAGNVGFDNAASLAQDSATAHTQGSFTKYTANASRLQGLNPASSLYFSVSGQWAKNNLDSAEKFVAGGPYTVRAYDMSALSGDTGYLGTLEYRHDLGLGNFLPGQWQGIAFYDSETLTINKTPWVAGANTASLSGAGVGLNWSGPANWSARAYVATPIGSAPVQITSVASTTGWLQVSKEF